MNLIEKSIKYLIDEVEGKTIRFEVEHPWRKDGFHIVQHSLRVKSYVKQIKKAEGIILNKIDEVALPLAAILHDIGRLYGSENHGIKSVEIIQSFLKSNIQNQDIINRINELIINHSNKNNRSNDLIMNLLIDADAIDEIGIQSIMMCSNWINRDSAFFFVDLQERLENRELEFIEKILLILYFNSSKKIVSGKIEFIKLVATQLQKENSGSLNRESYKKIITYTNENGD